MKKPRVWLVSASLFLPVALAFPCSLFGLQPTDQPPAALTQASGAGPAPASIRGVMWHEICEYSGGEGGEPVVLGRGCVQWGAGPSDWGPNQTRDDFEVGWAGVTLRLGRGSCPSTDLGTAVTNDQGEYRFDGLKEGKYCVSYGVYVGDNENILIPGSPTYPERGDPGYWQTVDLSAGEDRAVDLGYAWQFYR